ncbi:MAG: anhydro-N-acetylmuramic acid kinase [Bacteroidetes bacterium RIFCSPLOWO2_12_FULL_37_12]|nr:MAG: anhydro-N-acetylmuramic acid kinase [Bacteroidetes bacterium RIFCSPLOWO2_12_FULL_37_12]
MKVHKVIGIMSGTSGDGVDLAYCHFTEQDGKWKYSIENIRTIPFDHIWDLRLKELHHQNPIAFVKTDIFFGHYLGKLVNDFIREEKIEAELVSSHGHTVFHQPEKGITCQIGHGASIHAECGLPVVSDFRSLDVALGGQGAPLVSIADRMLFSEYDFCLNLGGIANLSAEVSQKRIAYDICPCNLILNYLAIPLGKSYDEGGNFARKGNINEELLVILNSLPYYKKHFPKSLGREWVDACIKPLLRMSKIPTEGKLATFCGHIAHQIHQSISELIQISDTTKKFRLLITGGGAYNQFLIETIRKYLSPLPVTLEIPDKNLIEFKEAMIFGFLGVLRIRNEVNCLSSVTGAGRDNAGGVVWGG